MFAVPMIPSARGCPGGPWCPRCARCLGSPGWSWPVPSQRQADPAAFVMGDLHGVHDLLHPQAVMEVALVALDVAEHLAGEVGGQVGVVQRAPGLVRRPASGGILLRHLYFTELDVIGPGDLQRLADAELLDQPSDRRSL